MDVAFMLMGIAFLALTYQLKINRENTQEYYVKNKIYFFSLIRLRNFGLFEKCIFEPDRPRCNSITLPTQLCPTCTASKILAIGIDDFAKEIEAEQKVRRQEGPPEV